MTFTETRHGLGRAITECKLHLTKQKKEEQGNMMRLSTCEICDKCINEDAILHYACVLCNRFICDHNVDKHEDGIVVI